MQTAEEITFRGLSPSSELDAEIRARIAWLQQFSPAIIACRVLVEIPHRHRNDGRHFHVRIDVIVPGGAPIVVSHSPSLPGPLKENHHLLRSAAAAIRDAFDIARRLLQDFAREQRGELGTRDTTMPHGAVSKLWPREGFGFIESDNRELYFSRSSVIDNRFEDMAVGTAVAFIEGRGDLGPQAVTVRVLRTPPDTRDRGHRSAKRR
jgi:cold shock CspA family protein